MRVKKADGTLCTDGCSNIRLSRHHHRRGRLAGAGALAASPESIAEEDDDSTPGTVENVSTVTASITNSKTFATDQVLSLTFGGSATYGTHYTVTPADGDANEDRPTRSRSRRGKARSP